MKRRWQKCIAVVVAMAMLMTAVPVGVFAKTVPLDDPSAVAFVWAKDRVQGVCYDNVDEAWKAAQTSGHILLLKDWNTTKVLAVGEDKEVRLFMNGFTVNRGRTSATDSGQVFLVRDGGSLYLYGSDSEDALEKATTAKVTGGYNADGGGGIHVQEKAGAYLYGVTVTGNATSDRNGGGGVRLQGDYSYLYMDAYSSVSENQAPKGDGGGVSVHGKGSKVEGGTVKNNSAGESGGGISVKNEGCAIAGVTITNNTAGTGKKGGGIYMGEGSGCSVFSCTVKENTVSDGNGGGIHVDGNNGSLSFSVVEKNTATLGGGVYIDVGDTLALSGELSIKENTAANKAAANLYLATTSKKAAYLSGYPTGGEVHIGWDTDMRDDDPVKLTTAQSAYDCWYLHCDVDGYTIYWSWLTEDGVNDRRIRAATTDYRQPITHSDTNVAVEDRYTVYKNGYLSSYDLQEGIFSYRGNSGGRLDAVYYYSDGYFIDKPESYNEHLATMTLAAVMSAFNADTTEFDSTLPNDGYANRFRHAMQLLSDIGIKNEDIHVSDSFTKIPTDSSIGVIMGAKELSFGKEKDDAPYVLLPIVVRGAGYGAEWASNVTLGQSGEAAGFSDAADKVMAEVEKYLASDLSLDLKTALEQGRVKFWVSGFSRAAATANLVAKRLTDTYGQSNSIYAYCFETPKGGVDAAVKNEPYTYNGQYLNIHNIINTGDIVPFVGPQEMGFKRYGVDHYVPGTDPGTVTESVYTTPKKVSVTTYADNRAYIVGESDYMQRREDMLLQLALLDDTILFDDYFTLATLNYVGNALSDNDMVGALENGTKTKAAQWIPLFVRNLVEWASNGTYSWSTVDGDGYGHDYRKFYSTNIRFSGEEYMTVEQSLQVFTKLLFGMENTDAFMEAMMYRMNDMAANDWTMLDFYIAVICMWDEQAQYRQRWYMNDVWDALTDDMVYPGGHKVPAITDFVPKEKETELKKATYSLLAFLFLFVCRDYDAELDLEGVDTKQVHLGTLLYNMSGVLQCHYPEVCMAWLRTYDNHYTNNPLGKYDDTAVHLVTDTAAVPDKVTATIVVTDDSSVITLSAPFGKVAGVDKNSTDNGAAIYYQICKDGVPVSDWQLYREAITLHPEEDGEYTLNAYAVRFCSKSAVLTLSDMQLRNGMSMIGTMLGAGSWIAILCYVLAAGVLVGGVVLYVRRKKKQAQPEPTEE